jgi:small subunit ribosomal protein S17
MADETEETTTEETAAEVTADASTDAAPVAAAAEETPSSPEPAAEATTVTEPTPAPVTARAPAMATPAVDGERPNRRKVREGVVVSDAMQSTVVVAVVERVRHPRYGKTVQRTKKLYVHDADDTAKVGDRVRVQETRPLSKLKRWRLTEVVERAR